MLGVFGVARPIIQGSRINQWRIVFEVKDDVLKQLRAVYASGQKIKFRIFAILGGIS